MCHFDQVNQSDTIKRLKEKIKGHVQNITAGIDLLQDSAYTDKTF